MSNVADTLEHAADLLETVGWVQGASVAYGEYDIDGRPSQIVGYCASGALHRASGLEYESAMSAMACEIVGCNGDHSGHLLWPMGLRSATVVGWNDEPGRTKYEVIDKMRRAAKNLRNEAAPE
jgi:hypothetical protein